jgi:cobalamin-dependent methionine synthase I
VLVRRKKYFEKTQWHKISAEQHLREQRARLLCVEDFLAAAP